MRIMKPQTRKKVSIKKKPEPKKEIGIDIDGDGKVDTKIEVPTVEIENGEK